MPLIEAVAGPPNTLVHDPATNAALRHFWSWMRDGVAPPKQARVELVVEEMMGGQLELVRGNHSGMPRRYPAAGFRRSDGDACGSECGPGTRPGRI